MKKVKKAVILAGGIGSRMMPLTRAIPKPMLPVVDKPLIDYLIEEVRQSGIQEIAIVVSHQKQVLENHLNDEENIYFFNQGEPNGTANALNRVKIFVQNEPFALLLGDEIFKSDQPYVGQLLESFYQNSHMNPLFVTGIEETTEEFIRIYNSLSLYQLNNNTYQINGILEKPQNEYPSNFTSVGRYILSSDIFDLIKEVKSFSSSKSEFYLTDVFSYAINQKYNSLGVLLEGKRYDIGSKLGWLKANVELAIDNHEFMDWLAEFHK